ncbi:uncharacterized protein LOC116617810 [Nematostella vectensis]|uniref:uncharacterized protein LOC116617810 n=1 Tax=Nematostella vectensis TaxID=45351 RepID=UPI002077476C|nr:uncharacterized protein LOC116617810 [Nematostella vectensis]
MLPTSLSQKVQPGAQVESRPLTTSAMKLLIGCLGLVVLLGAVTAQEDIASELKKMKTTLAAMTRQMMLQQLFVEERIRSDANSGVKRIRHNREGTRNYYAKTHTGATSVLAIHDHSNNDRTVGMGEFVGVLNGVEFRTRHNDYRLYMPHRTSAEYHDVENIPFPDVPPEVTQKKTVSEEIAEMREWFKAFKTQNHTVRDYRKYFKPVLCYLEGWWANATSDHIDEGFESDRHFIDATSWFDLQQKIRFTSYSGRKDNLENYSFLPTSIFNVDNDGYPQFAQWNYRILCNPVGRDIPLNRFRMVDEIGPRMARKRTFDEQVATRAARFQLNPMDTDKFVDRSTNRWALLDELMSEIPGKDNYQGDLQDEAFGLTAYTLKPGSKSKLKADRYHRWFKVTDKGAMGESDRHRGFSDENLFMAMTTQPKVAGMDQTLCEGRGKKKKCTTRTQRWTYAIPLEVIYLTPLSKWNPYKLHHKGAFNTPLGRTVEQGNRNGGKTLDKAFNGTHSKKYYLTPNEFFSGEEVGSGAADTTRNAVGVLNKDGTKVHLTRATGTRIFFPSIEGVGVVRQRYPIMPVHGEGSSVWKELEALKDVVFYSKTNGYILRESLNSGPIPTEPPQKSITLQVASARKDPPGAHTHQIITEITPDQVENMKKGKSMKVRTSERAGHDHDMVIKYNKWKKQFMIETCDQNDKGGLRCWDQHPKFLVAMPDE